MRLAISVIGWEQEDDKRAYPDVGAAGAQGIEAVPTRIWGSWEAATDEAVDRWREKLASHGLECPALQSLFYGIEGASLTGTASERQVAAEQLTRVARLAGRLGAGAAVLGSPSNRRRGELSFAEAEERARDTVLSAADAFADAGAKLGIEPNPPDYGCDFLISYAEVREFVEGVDHPAVAPHLDAGALRINDEDPVLEAPLPAHVHLSTPHLRPFDGLPEAWHAELVSRLHRAGYEGWFSIEQRPHGDRLLAANQALRAARKLLDGDHE